MLIFSPYSEEGKGGGGLKRMKKMDLLLLCRRVAHDVIESRIIKVKLFCPSGIRKKRMHPSCWSALVIRYVSNRSSKPLDYLRHHHQQSSFDNDDGGGDREKERER